MTFRNPSTLLIVGGATAAAVLIGAAWAYVKRRNSHGTCNAHRGKGQRAIWFFDSHLGSIEVQVFGPSAGPLVLALHGLNPAGPIRYEWDNTAYQVSQQGYRVIIPQLHSNPRTAPAVSSKHQAQLTSIKMCPVAVFWAKDDFITPIANIKIFQQARLANLTVRTHESGGHMILPT
eukprot:g2291.t1